MFSGTIFGGIAAALIFELPWRQEKDDRLITETEAAASAMDLLNSLLS